MKITLNKTRKYLSVIAMSLLTLILFLTSLVAIAIATLSYNNKSDSVGDINVIRSEFRQLAIATESNVSQILNQLQVNNDSSIGQTNAGDSLNSQSPMDNNVAMENISQLVNHLINSTQISMEELSSKISMLAIVCSQLVHLSSILLYEIICPQLKFSLAGSIVTCRDITQSVNNVK